MENGSDSIVMEMMPIAGATNAHKQHTTRMNLMEPTQHHARMNKPAWMMTEEEVSLERQKDSASRRVRKTYLSMIGLAFFLTMISPGTIMWSSLCDQSLVSINATTPNVPITNSSSDVFAAISEYNQSATSKTSYPSGENNTIQTATAAKCIYGSINISTLAKLTVSTLTLIILFVNLQGSDPGLLTNEIMRRLDAFEGVVTTITITGGNNGEDGDSDADLERQGFLEPLPLLHIKDSTLPLPQCQKQHPKLYPHTRRKYCAKCQIHPPLRSHHCNTCNRCIATFDHHCLFLVSKSIITVCIHCLLYSLF